MNESKPAIQSRIIISIVLPVFLVGLAISTIAAHFSTAPLIEYFKGRNEADLTLAADLGFAICERRLSELLSLRLESDKEMVDSFRAEALREVTQVSAKFRAVNMMVIEDSQKIVGSSIPERTKAMSLPPLTRTRSGVMRQRLGGQWAWMSYRYFPLWKWHIISFVYEKEYLAPIFLAKKMVYYASFSVLILVVLLVLLVFSRRVNAPLRRIVDAAEAVGHGRFIKIELNRQDEIGRVALAFDSMVDSLKQDQENITKILAELRESEERYRLLTENSLTCIIMVQDGRLIYANRRVIDLSGYSAEALTGMHVLDIVHPEDQESVGQRIAFHSESDTFIDHCEFRYITKGGDARWLEILAVPMIYKGERATLGHGIDITDRKAAASEQKQLERKLLQAQKLETIGTLAGGIAHDFNNILSVIMGYTEMALLGVQEDQVKGNLERVLNAGQRAKELVSQILAFSRKREHEQKAIAICSVVKETMEFLRASLPSTITIQLDVMISPEEGVIIADPTQIHQILLNLCTNAADAMREWGGMLQVSVAEEEVESRQASLNPDLHEGCYVKLTVRDTGHGMEAGVLDRIFDPFFTTKEPGRGTGLGLAVVHGIIKACDGAITVSSKVGEGTTFDVYFPLAGGASTPLGEQPAAFPRGSESILFVDDEQMLVELESEMLGSLGYQVTAVASSMEALDVFRSRPQAFDLVITDQTMPKLTGVELAKELIRIRSDIPIILCTGYSDRVTREGAFSMGIREFLLKPIRGAEMATVVRDVLNQSFRKRLI